MTNYLPKLLVTGGQGQIAQAIANHSFASEFEIILCGHEELDITQPASIEAAIEKYLPDIVINTAAYTAVDKAESEVSTADRVNHMGAGQLALICNKNQIKLIHLSTDYIFDGNKDGKYNEEDEANPLNIYGKSKLEGEVATRKACPNHLILRVSGVFSEYGKNFLKNILQLAHERMTLSIVSDQMTCPTYAGDVAYAILKMCQTPSHKGTFHFCSDEAVSWHDFAQAIIDEAEKHEKLTVNEVKAIKSADYPTPAKRPRFSVLNCAKIKTTFDIDQPSWHQTITRIIPKLIQEKA
tara:strand:+ start:520 stop:1407 length:888 start_codon:yes stop_codon:yes gene_type:complete